MSNKKQLSQVVRKKYLNLIRRQRKSI